MSGNSATTSTPGYASLARGHDVYTHEDGADRAASVARSSELTLREASYYELPDVRQSIDADVRTLLSQGGVGLTTRWFHGDLSGKEAEKLLMETDIDGAFLVRRSKSNTNNFTLTVFQRSRNACTHNKIRRIEGFYDMYGGTKFETLSDLIVFHASNPRSLKQKDGTIIELKWPLLSECVTERSWYHGSIPGRGAESLLQGAVGESFLVRDSIDPGCLVVSTKTEDGKIVHLLVRRVDEKFDAGGGDQFSTLDELVEYYGANPMRDTASGEIVRLTHPVDRLPKPKDESPAAAYAELTGDHRLYNAAAYALLNGEHVVHREGEPRAQYATPAWVTGGSNTEYYSEVVDAVSPIGGTLGTSGHISDAPSHLYASATAEEVAQGAASAVYYSEILDPVDRKSTAADPKGAPRHTYENLEGTGFSEDTVRAVHYWLEKGLTRDDAEQAVAKFPQGTFVIRKCAAKGIAFALTLHLGGKRFRHYRLQSEGHDLAAPIEMHDTVNGNRSFLNAFELIKYYQMHQPGIKRSLPCQLGDPPPIPKSD